MIRFAAILPAVTLLAGTGCATSMTPSQFLSAFPEATKSRFIASADAKALVENGTCEVRVANRKYSSPIGLSVNADLRGGAKGVDEWVAADGGNAYVVNTCQWVTVGEDGTTQLVVDFDTLRCT